MSLLNFLNSTYATFLSIFPVGIHWLISLIVLISLVVGFYNLIRRHWIFLIIAVLLLPFLLPILGSIFGALFDFAKGLFGQAQTGI